MITGTETGPEPIPTLKLIPNPSGLGTDYKPNWFCNWSWIHTDPWSWSYLMEIDSESIKILEHMPNSYQSRNWYHWIDSQPKPVLDSNDSKLMRIQEFILNSQRSWNWYCTQNIPGTKPELILVLNLCSFLFWCKNYSWIYLIYWISYLLQSRIWSDSPFSHELLIN